MADGTRAAVPSGWVTRDSGIVMPPVQPDERPELTQLARPAIVDRYPLIIGEHLTGQYLSAAYRLCNTGWRYQFVDVIDELLEHDPDTRGPLRQRVFGVAFGRVQVSPPKLRVGHKLESLAKDIADRFDEQFQAVPRLAQRLAQLNWAVIYGISGSEVKWDHSSGEWGLVGLSNIRNRRLNYTNPSSWDLFVWDQGTVGPGYDQAPTNRGIHGLNIREFPGKFIVHTPSLNSDYPTRDGEARYIGMFMLLKRMVTRCSAQDFERVIRPWVVAYFNKDAGDDGKQSAATKEDIDKANQAIDGFGMGAMNGATLPATIKLEILKAAAAMSSVEFLSYLNKAIAKSLLGQAFTTEPGANGNFSTAQVAEKQTLKILKYDARCLCDSLEEDLAWKWTQLNFPGAPRIISPKIDIMVDELPTPQELLTLATTATAIDIPVDADEIGTRAGLPVIASDDRTARRTRMLSAGKGPTPEDPANPNPDESGGAEGAQKPVEQDSNPTPPNVAANEE